MSDDNSRPRRPAPRDVTELNLKDGLRVWVRPIREDDRPQLVEAWGRLSDRSRYMRFHSAVNVLSDTQLDYLLNVDHHDHEALVAVDPDAPGEPGIGVARYIRLDGEPTIAEAAITVVDDYQRRGVGTTLIALLERAAYERGIRLFRNYVLAENRSMLEIFRQLGGELHAEGGTVFRVDMPIPAPDEDRPETPTGRWVAEVGRQAQSPDNEWAYPVLWAYRRISDLTEAIGETHPSKLLKRWADAVLSGDDAELDDTGPDHADPDDADPDDADPDGADPDGDDPGQDGEPEDQSGDSQA